MRASVISLVVLALGWSATRTASAQQPATIPTDLALALIDNNTNAYGSRAPRITVGQAPARVPASLTSADGAVVLGGIEFPDRATVVLSFTLPANQVLAAFDKQLLAHGWSPPPPPPDERGGFVSGGYSSSWGNVYCADSGVAMISSVPAPGGGTFIRVQHMRNAVRSVCNPQRYGASYNMPVLKFPALFPPVGMEQGAVGSCGGSDRFEISTRLVGAREPLDILTHYVKQLESAGWKMGAPLSGDGMAATSARTREDGVDWTGTITATRVTPSEVEVTIHMMHPSER